VVLAHVLQHDHGIPKSAQRAVIPDSLGDIDGAVLVVVQGGARRLHVLREGNRRTPDAGLPVVRAAAEDPALAPLEDRAAAFSRESGRRSRQPASNPPGSSARTTAAGWAAGVVAACCAAIGFRAMTLDARSTSILRRITVSLSCEPASCAASGGRVAHRERVVGPLH
jgi:hypothetical protein